MLVLNDLRRTEEVELVDEASDRERLRFFRRDKRLNDARKLFGETYNIPTLFHQQMTSTWVYNII